MASLDVSEALDCPEFQTEFKIIRRTYDVSEASGETVLVESEPEPATGVLQAAAGKDIERLPEALRSHDPIRIYFKGFLSPDDEGKYSDVILYDGIRFQVFSQDDWSNWGQGYVKIIAIMEKPSYGE
jgi:hypothetical protein